MMKIATQIRAALAAALAAGALNAAAQNAQETPEPAVLPTSSVQEADVRLAAAAAARAAAEAEYADSEQVCYARFFVNHCLAQAKEKRHRALLALRQIEVEANHFKRADSVARRDRALAERQQQDAADAAARAAAPPKAPKVVMEPVLRPPAARDADQRQAEYDAREQRRLSAEAADAGKRAARAAAFDQKQRDAAERQRVVAAKLAEKEQAARKAEAEAAKQQDTR